MRSLLASRTAWAERSRSSSLSQTQAACARGPVAAGAHPAAGDGVLLAGYLPATPPARAAEPRTRTTRPAAGRSSHRTKAVADLLDGEGALHAGLAVAGDRAEEGVAPGLQVDRRIGRAARDQVGLAERLPRRVLDGDVVLERLLVVEVDRHGTGLRADVLLVVCEVAAGRGGDVDSCAAAGRRCGRGARRGSGRVVVVVPAAAGREAERGQRGHGEYC